MAINKVVYGNTTLIDLTGDTVASEKMLQGTTAHASNGDAVTGTIITKTSSALSASGSIVTVPSGYYASQATKAVASVVQATPTITVSAAGLITATTTQSAGYVAAGSKSATKQLTAKAAATYTPNTKNQTIASGQYLKGVQTIKGDANLVAANIKNNVSIFGVKGTYETPAYAVIGVIYPAGSTCTCTNDTKTLTLKDTSGQGFFLIPYAETWTVTCTDGTRTKSKNVRITANGQSVMVELTYEVFLFNNGVVVPFSKKAQEGATVSVGSTISFGSGTSSTGYERGAVAYTTSKVDLTKYNAVVFKGNFTHVINSNAARSIAGVITQTPTTNSNQDSLYAASAYLDVKNDSWTVNIRSLSGKYYICVSAGNGFGENLIGNITKIYLM